jgi:hypothetical protein
VPFDNSRHYLNNLVSHDFASSGNLYRRKSKTLLEPPTGGGKSRAEQLEEIGFVWHTGRVRPSFEERLEECRDFRREHDHLRIPLLPKCSPDDPPESQKMRSFYQVNRVQSTLPRHLSLSDLSFASCFVRCPS